MRVYEGDYAYEVEQIFDDATRLPKSWRYNIFQIRPRDKKISSGEAPTREAAEKLGRKKLNTVQRRDISAT
jgi:hypothetical protein